MRKFSTRPDPELLAYLKSRRISPRFLADIDSFILRHPQIRSTTKGRQWIGKINTATPLHAYKHFMTGYTLPARYVHGTIVTGDLDLPYDSVPFL